MGRILWWLILACIGWFVWRSRSRVRSGTRPGMGAGVPPGTGPASAPTERMLDCAHCGLHLPASETVPDGQGRRYCCAAHRDAGPRPD